MPGPNSTPITKGPPCDAAPMRPAAVRGVVAPTPRLTPLGAALIAAAIALPAGAAIWLIELVFF